MNILRSGLVKKITSIWPGIVKFVKMMFQTNATFGFCLTNLFPEIIPGQVGSPEVSIEQL